MAEKKQEQDVNLEKQKLDNIYAESVHCSKVGINNLNAGKVEMDQSGVAYLRAQSVSQKNCGNAFIYAKSLKTDSVKSIVVISDEIEGSVTTLLDKKGAAIFALVFAAVMLFFRIIRRLAR